MTAKKDGLGWFAKTLIAVGVLGGGAYVGATIWAAIPPSPLTSDEQAKLRTAGIVWASPDAPTPAGIEHMLLFGAVGPNPQAPLGVSGSVNTEEICAVGAFRLAKLVVAGWRFWRPRTPLDTAKESATNTTHKAGA